MDTQGALARLKELSALGDADDFVAEVLLNFAAPYHEGKGIAPYRKHIADLVKAAQDHYVVLRDGGASDDAGTRLAALKFSIMHDAGYTIVRDERDGNIFSSLNLISAIDERKASPLMIGGLFYQISRQCGWDIEILNFPSCAALRMQAGGQSLIIDPGQYCKIMQAHELRALIKEDYGQQAELNPSILAPMSVADICVAIHNDVKLYKIAQDDYDSALGAIQMMQIIAPHEYRLYLDAGVLYAKTRQTEPAIFALNHYIGKATDKRSRDEAQALLDELKNMV